MFVSTSVCSAREIVNGSLDWSVIICSYFRLYNENRSPGLEPVSLHNFHSKETMHADARLDALVRGLATQSAQKMDLHHSHRVSIIPKSRF